MNQKGFATPAILIVGAVLILGFGGYIYFLKNKQERFMSVKNRISPVTENKTPIQPTPRVIQKWSEAKKTEPAAKTSCLEPVIFDLPIDINKATSVLYPGQIRGGDYKAHGGFRFDKSRPDEITVVAPIDASVIAGARYPVNGEIQYTLDFENSCGIRYRLGHILKLTPKFRAIAEKFPLPATVDSRTTQVYPPVQVKKGEVIATAIGLMGTGVGGTGQVNTFLDWGVYDYRQKK